MTLDQRMQAAADYIIADPGRSCVDVGTDHAYLPVYLYEASISKSIIACDINEKPLQTAARTLKEHGLTDKITLIQSDGLSKIMRAQAQDIIICGMGGELILSILQKAPFKFDAEQRLILQPMTNVPLLRRGLYENGFEILEETPVALSSHIYTVLLVAFTGKTQTTSELFALVGEIPQSKNTDKEAYLKHIAKRELTIAAGLSRAENEKEKAAKHQELACAILKLLDV